MLVNKTHLETHYYLVSQNIFFSFSFFFWNHHLEPFKSRREYKRVNECHSHHINYLL